DACLKYARQTTVVRPSPNHFSGRNATISINGGPAIPVSSWEVRPLPDADAEEGEIEVTFGSPVPPARRLRRRRKTKRPPARGFGEQALEAMRKGKANGP